MDIGNRLLWTLIAILLVAAGGTATAASTGAIPRLNRNTTLLPDTFLDRWRDWGQWAWAGLAVTGLLIALLGLLLTRAELRRRGGSGIGDLTDLPPPATTTNGHDRLPGRTRVHHTALTHGIEHDLTRHPNVQRASTRLVGDPTRPDLRIHLHIAPGTNLTNLRQHLSTSLDRFTTTTALHPAAVHVQIRLDESAHTRVR